jgi:hypothetical protein
MVSHSPSAERNRRYRKRQHMGERVYPTAIPDQVIEVAINAGWLTEEESQDRDKVGQMMARIALEWAKQWSDYFGTRPA